MKKINFGLLFALFCVLWACADEKQGTKKRFNFRLPIIVDIPPVEEIADDYGLFSYGCLGAYNFGDTVNLNNQAISLKIVRENNSPNPIYDMVGQNDISRFWVADSNFLTNLKIVVDNRQAFAYSERQDVDSFLLLYIVNETMQKKVVWMADNDICTSLEAENERKEWQSITSNGCPWCGNSYHWFALQAKKFMAFKIPKTKGDFKTRLRVKFENGVVYYSQPYEGFIDKKQLQNKNR